MNHKLLTAKEIQRLGFDLNKYEVVKKYCLVKDGRIDLAATIKRMETSRAFYKRLLDEAFDFKSKHGVDYSDFTDRHDENIRNYNEHDKAISYLTKILQATEG
jgi:hypothetical protein